jgi:RNA polymerase-binding transcription factor DksA
MQTQGSSGANDGDGGGDVEGAPTAADRDAVPFGDVVRVQAGRDDSGHDDSGTAADGTPSDDAGSGMPTDGTEGEEEAHRSAVDAVDGLLDEVELALARLDDGTYGRCEECGSPIDDARLAGSPIERTCGTCVIGGSVAASSDRGPSGMTDGRGPSSGPLSHVGPAGTHRV